MRFWIVPSKSARSQTCFCMFSWVSAFLPDLLAFLLPICVFPTSLQNFCLSSEISSKMGSYISTFSWQFLYYHLNRSKISRQDFINPLWFWSQNSTECWGEKTKTRFWLLLLTLSWYQVTTTRIMTPTFTSFLSDVRINWTKTDALKLWCNISRMRETIFIEKLLLW